MSLEINTCEMLRIKNENAATAEIAKKLVDYLQQLNSRKGLESLYVGNLSLDVDGKKVQLASDDDEVGPLWSEDGEFTQLVARIPEGKVIAYAASFTAEVYLGVDYGYHYFHEIFVNASNVKELADCVTYKCLEYYDQDENVISYRLEQKDGELLPEYPKSTDDLSIVEDITDWYSSNFFCEISFDEPIDEDVLEDFQDKLQEAYGDFPEIEEDDDVTLLIEDTVVIAADQISQFEKYLQAINEFASNRNAQLSLTATFTPDAQYEFALLSFATEDGEIVARATRY